MAGEDPGADGRRAWRRRACISSCGAQARPGTSCPTCCARRSAGGVEVFQLREKDLPDDELAAVANAARRSASARGAVRSSTTARTWRARRAPTACTSARTTCPCAEVREIVGAEMLVGLSTHTPARDRRGRPGARRLHRRRPGARDADQAGPPGGRAGAGRATPPRTPGAVLRDRRPRRGQHRRGARRRAPRGCACCARSPTPRTPRRRAGALRRAASRTAQASARRTQRPGAASPEQRPRARTRAPRARALRAARPGRAPGGAAGRDRRVRSLLAVGGGRRRADGPRPLRHGGSLPGAIFLAGVLVAARARACTARRYWAVLGFEALLAFQILVTSLALVVASTLARGRRSAWSAIGLGGWLFWKLVRVMGAHPGGRRTSAFDRLSAQMAESSYDCIVIGSGPGRLRGRDPRRPARAEDRRRRARQGRRALPELRVHPRQGGAALGRPAHRDPRGGRLRPATSAASRSTTPPSRRAARRSSRRSPRASAGLFKKNGIDLIEGDARADRRRRRARRRGVVGGRAA